MTSINISRRELKDEFHKERQAILIITTDMVMKNIITSIKDLTTLMMIIYLQFTNWGGRGPILMITTDTFWQESVAQDVVKRSYLHLSPPLSLECCKYYHK